jgi:hypothetical protein
MYETLMLTFLHLVVIRFSSAEPVLSCLVHRTTSVSRTPWNVNLNQFSLVLKRLRLRSPPFERPSSHVRK